MQSPVNVSLVSRYQLPASALAGRGVLYPSLKLLVPPAAPNELILSSKNSAVLTPRRGNIW